MIKVYIDCGHGGKDSGAVNGSYYEKNYVLSVGLHLKKLLLETKKFNVKLSRETDVYKTLEQRTNDANSWGADIFISLHCNSSTNKSALGIETYCYKFKYRKLADSIHNALIQDKLYTKNRGVKEGNFHVIRESKMSACLIELAFISNSQDLQLLQTKQYEFAKAIYKGILNYYNIKIEISDKLYIVATGAYKDIQNAKNDVEELKKKGFNSAYIHIDKEVQ